MSYEFEEEVPTTPVPRGLLIGAGLLIVSSIALAASARYTGSGRLVAAASSIHAEREIVFHSRADSVLEVRDPATDAVIRQYPPGEGGMVRGALRAFAYTRQVAGSHLEGVPYRLTLFQSGRLTLTDPKSRAVIELNSFGPTNTEAFRQLLDGAPLADVSVATPAR